MKDSKKTLNAAVISKLSGIIPAERIYCIDFPRPSKDVINRYLALGMQDLTSALSDMLDERGIQGTIPASTLQPIIAGKRIVGPAVTLKIIPERKVVVQRLIDQDKPRFRGTFDAADIAKPGDVIVIDGGGRLISAQGYLLAVYLKTKGLAATILDCGTRDIGGIRKIDYPTWARGVTPITGKHRFEAYEVNGPVVCAGVTVYPGDLVVADDSGVVFVPSPLVGDVLLSLEKSTKKEKEVESGIRKGMSFAEAARNLPQMKKS